MLPVIGITCTRIRGAGGGDRFGLNDVYVRAVMNAGGAPLLIPLDISEEALRAIYKTLEGLLLSGGVDVAPHRYGETPHPGLGEVDAGRDEVELALARWAVADDLPLLAICRGIQLLNVALGGTLYQDIPSQVPHALVHPHQEGNRRDHIAHTVHIVPGSRLHRILRPEGGALPVNSMHHQAVKDVAPGCIVTARAPDGIIEALEEPTKRFVVGVQWHPEEMAENDARMRSLFAHFVAAARKSGGIRKVPPIHDLG